MTAQSSPLRLGAIVLAVVLAGSYVWFRVAQAREGAAADGPGATTVPTTATTTQPAVSVLPGSKSASILPGSKSFIVHQPSAATAPATAPRPRPSTLIYGSKSAPVDLIPRTATTAPAKSD